MWYTLSTDYIVSKTVANGQLIYHNMVYRCWCRRPPNGNLHIRSVSNGTKKKVSSVSQLLLQIHSWNLIYVDASIPNEVCYAPFVFVFCWKCLERSRCRSCPYMIRNTCANVTMTYNVLTVERYVWRIYSSMTENEMKRSSPIASKECIFFCSEKNVKKMNFFIVYLLLHEDFICVIRHVVTHSTNTHTNARRVE